MTRQIKRMFEIRDDWNYQTLMRSYDESKRISYDLLGRLKVYVCNQIYIMFF